MARSDAAEKEAPARLGLVGAQTPSAEPFRTIRLSLQLRPSTSSPKLVVVTSADPGEGKSTIAANFALVSAVNENRVLLVDADLRKPMQHSFFGVRRTPGLTDILAGRTDFGSAIYRIADPGGTDSDPRFDLLAAGTALTNAGDVTASATMSRLLEATGRSYDMVVLDTPPVLAAADAANLAASTNADVILVVSRKGRKRHLQRALEKLELVGANVLGFVVNREGRLADYGYY